jgi:hypothetical protein
MKTNTSETLSATAFLTLDIAIVFKCYLKDEL